jgi:transposase
MRGTDPIQHPLFSYVSQEDRIPADHPLRAIRKIVDASLQRLTGEFAKLYSTTGRPSIAPEQLLRALLLQVFYTIRSERQLMEQLDYNLLFRWFVGLSMDDPIWDATVFTKNRDRLLAGDVAEHFFQQILAHARGEGLLSNDHFTVDGTLLEAWASQKSFQQKAVSTGVAKSDDDPSNPSINFHGEKRSNDTHQSISDPDARLTRKGPGKEARLCYSGHVLMNNRHGLAEKAVVTITTGTAERDAALAMLEELAKPTIGRRRTVAADKGYDTRDFVAKARAINFTPHVAQNTNGRSSAIDDRTTRHPGYAVSQRRRKRIEEIFGWLKTVGNMRKLRHRGREIVDWIFTFTVAGYNLVRIVNLARVAAAT